MKLRLVSAIVPLVLGIAFPTLSHGYDAQKLKTKNVILVTADGLRWQEVFRGAEEGLISKENGGIAEKRIDGVRKAYWRDSIEERRKALMPFFWSTLVKEGQLYGNADKGSKARLTNGLKFSYPGYNEIFTGWGDPRIDSNDKVPNPNVTVFEWLNRKPEFQGKVTAVGCWDVYPFILNTARSGIFINSGWEPIAGTNLNEKQQFINRLIRQSPQQWKDCRDDAITFEVALDHLKSVKPRVFYLGFGDTDEHAHSGFYEDYLRATQSFDENMKTLWETLQSIPQYRDSTSLIFTTDHGRGNAPKGWQSHGEKVEGAENIWVGILGPDTPALGERSQTAEVTQSQVAATIAALLSEDYNAAAPSAAKPITEALPEAAAPVPEALRAAPKTIIQRIAFGSCATQERPQPIWEFISARKPQLFLFLGDNIYADTENMAVMKEKYHQLAEKPGFKILRSQVPILATWDDHDLGVNDGGSNYPKKVDSQKVFCDFFGDAPDSPRRSRPGVYEAHVFGPVGKRVQIIMLDTRYFRSDLKKDPVEVKGKGPYLPNNDPNATILGADQWKWLAEQLKVPAEVRLLVSSIQVIAEDHGWEKWMNIPKERERLFQLVRSSKANGVVFLSGDRHLAELSMTDDSLGYPTYDLTSSGLNQGSKEWRSMETNRARVATMNWGDNFGFVEIDWERAVPQVKLQICDVIGDIRIQEKVPIKLLQPASAKP